MQPDDSKIIVYNTKHNGKIQHTQYLEVRQDDNFVKRTHFIRKHNDRHTECTRHAWSPISTRQKSNKNKHNYCLNLLPPINVVPGVFANGDVCVCVCVHLTLIFIAEYDFHCLIPILILKIFFAHDQIQDVIK